MKLSISSCWGRASETATTMPPPPESGVQQVAIVTSCINCGAHYTRAQWASLPSRRTWREVCLELAECSGCGWGIATDLITG